MTTDWTTEPTGVTIGALISSLAALVESSFNGYFRGRPRTPFGFGEATSEMALGAFSAPFGVAFGAFIEEAFGAFT